LFLPATVICTVLPVVPVWILGDAGPTTMLDKVGFTKKPRQLIAKARVASTARAPAMRSLCCFEDMILRLLGRACCAQKPDLLKFCQNSMPWRVRQRSFAAPDSPFDSAQGRLRAAVPT